MEKRNILIALTDIYNLFCDTSIVDVNNLSIDTPEHKYKYPNIDMMIYDLLNTIYNCAENIIENM